MTDLSARVRDLIRQEMRMPTIGSDPGPAPEQLPSSYVDKIFLCTAVEEEFDLAFRTERFIKCQTVADVCALVDQQLRNTA